MTPKPTERELDLLKILWERERATVREIYETLHARDTQLAYTTVLSLLQTMERKGLVGHEAEGKAYTYFAAVQRERTFRELAGSFLEQVFGGAMDEYLVRAMESRQPTARELDQLEAMIADYKQRRRSRKKDTPS
ncbi:MAG: BlaI/MecI/CopY family transcriptional regulator [Pirellulaceae bacterium]|nr:BlaI/MecI/CopY family transcriptional regulator [Planctomycetales bacterium]MCA9205068.1 BlaI/MecI/CopY family transcriptional regulator [Planctomycetales bacterium]MCA9208153.1 BlaI/MecI/CopY family transcriptional regulator [Planctomycetales bacterium]MCA9222131.1 BlaI/MecI/CopY family transcriptional regulator [Planctomycetales bacterium]